MKLVVDTNILVSFFRDNPVRQIITKGAFLGLELFTPEYALEELMTNKSALIKYTKKSDKEVDSIIVELNNFIKIEAEDVFKEFKERAKQVSPDEKDAPFFALALKLDAAIWSNEPRLKKQSVIKVFNTREIFELIDL